MAFRHGGDAMISSRRLAAAFGVCFAVAFAPLHAADELFSTGFDAARVVPSGKPSHDWLELLLPSGEAARPGIQYEGGTAAARYARVIDDPTHPGNKVLHYWLKDARAAGQRSGHYKGRIQLNLVNLNKRSVYQAFRMYLHPDLAHYRSYPKQNTWFTINELWFGAAWKDADYPFRISLDIVKERGAGAPLLLAASGSVNVRGRWEHVWGSVNKNFAVPVGEWLDVEVGYQQGNAQSGRFYVAVKPASAAAKTEVLNVTNWTYHPRAPRPVPLTHWQPLKVYTSDDIIDHVLSQGGVVQIYWDDLRIWEGWPR
jgi:hypothetical protein